MNFRKLFVKLGIKAVWGSKPVKFVIAGLINTGLTYLVYLGLLLFLDYRIAYAVSYASGIALAFSLNSIMVFKVNFSFVRMIIYPLIYLSQYIANASLLALFVGKWHIHKEVAPLLAICITMPIIYLLNKFILTTPIKKKNAIS